MQRKTGLGKGLSALIPEKGPTLNQTDSDYKVLDLKEIEANPYQPRKRFVLEKLESLKCSMAEDGLLQPIVVLRKQDGGYLLVAGERRFRAAKSLGWKNIPAIMVDDMAGSALLRKSLVENVQRQNLNAIEEARAYKKLRDSFEYTIERIAGEIGKDVSTISNSIRLLALPEEVQQEISAGEISAGHARALLMLKEKNKMLSLLKGIKEGKLSVRESERRVRGIKAQEDPLDPNLTVFVDKLQHQLGTKIKIIKRRKGGKIEVSFFNKDDLNRILELMLEVS